MPFEHSNLTPIFLILRTLPNRMLYKKKTYRLSQYVVVPSLVRLYGHGQTLPGAFYVYSRIFMLLIILLFLLLLISIINKILDIIKIYPFALICSLFNERLEGKGLARCMTPMWYPRGHLVTIVLRGQGMASDTSLSCTWQPSVTHCLYSVSQY